MSKSKYWSLLKSAGYVRGYEYNRVPGEIELIKRLFDTVDELKDHIVRLESYLMDRDESEDSGDEDDPVDFSQLNNLVVKFHKADPLVTAARRSRNGKSILLVNNEYGIEYILYEIVLQEFNWEHLDDILAKVEKMAKENPDRRHNLRLMVE